ncbi:MAG: hypothetical protein GXP08_08410 [Gammaproteobacteria bacterium]|nr:hypothetical protein [Gammaproteobacteria bacterium]
MFCRSVCGSRTPISENIIFYEAA